MRRLSPLMLAILLLTAIPLVAQQPDTGEPPLKVDLNQRGVIEKELNLRERPTLWLSAVNGDVSVTDAKFNVEGTEFKTSDLILQFAPCKGSTDDKFIMLTTKQKVLPCSFTVESNAKNTSRGAVTAPPRSMQIAVTGTVNNSAVTRYVKLELNYRYFGMSYSGGLLLSSQRDDRYTLKTETGGTQTAVLAGREDLKRALIALGTISLNGRPALGASFGVGTESAQLNDLLLLAGGSIAIRPRRVIDSIIITLGGAYIPRQTLKPEFVGTGKIPAGVELKDTVERRRSLKPFLSITFRTSGNPAAVRTPLGGTPSQ